MNTKNVIHGFIYISIFFIIYYLCFKDLKHELGSYDGVKIASMFLFIPVFYCLWGGVLWAIEGIIPLGRSNSGSGERDNIQNLKDFRDSKMGGMTYEKGSELYYETTLLDSVDNDSSVGNNTKNTRDYINSKLGGMTYKDGLNWIKGKK